MEKHGRKSQDDVLCMYMHCISHWDDIWDCGVCGDAFRIVPENSYKYHCFLIGIMEMFAEMLA